MTTATDLTELTVTESARLIAARQLSPVELTRALLDRIGEVGGPLAAFTTVHVDDSLAVARAAETMLGAGYRLGPLHGVPIAVKDNVAVAGRVTSAGSRILADWVPEEDATVATRLKGAGANLIANTNMHEFAWGATSENPHYGCVRNPWDTTRIASGSSGGSGAAVAAGAVPAALGTDTGGSIRLPSSANGIVGIRPTIGRVSNAGIIPLAWSLDTCGPMTRTVEDCALLLGLLAGHDPADPGTSRCTVPDYTASLREGVRGLRVGVIRDHALTQVQPVVRAATERALATLESLGAEIVDIRIPDIEGNVSALMTVESSEPSAYHQRWLRERPDDYGENVRFMFEQGELYLATHYIQAQRYRRLLRDRFLAAFQRSVDVVAMPTIPFTAPAVGTETIELEPGVVQPTLVAIMRYTGLASLTGMPALSLPSGFDDDGLPIGLQLMGAPFAEARLFQAGHAFEQATDFHVRRPAL
ncbi:amidase [Streptomyces solisilvae]|uniref:amidase n=1 Tax=Streptomyces malaysiensis TaxID=92644 RepID=UPI0036999AA6